MTLHFIYIFIYSLNGNKKLFCNKKRNIFTCKHRVVSYFIRIFTEYSRTHRVMYCVTFLNCQMKTVAGPKKSLFPASSYLRKRNKES